MSTRAEVEAALVVAFTRKHVTSAVKHFAASTDAFHRQQWEQAINKAGQFVEAVLKAIWLHVGGTLPPARQFKAGNVIRDLKQLPVGTYADAIRITLPRACEFAYDIASNRGARHDPDDVDPNEMDATVVAGVMAWVLAELVRYAQKGSTDAAKTKDMISGIVQRRYPLIEDIDGRTYFHLEGLSARQVAVLTLWHRHPQRLTRDQLVAAVVRNGFSASNAGTAVSRISAVVDVDDRGEMRLLQPGIAEAEELVKSHSV